MGRISRIDCPACLMGECICPSDDPLAVRIEVVIVRHAAERHKVSGTARLVPLAIRGARIIDVGVAGGIAATALNENNPDGSAVLFPGGRSIVDVAPKLRRLVVVDGTWAQARRMRKRVPMLASLSAVSLPPGLPTLRLRTPRHDGELATAEAVARALDAIGEPTCAARLRAIYQRLHSILTRPGRRGTRRTRVY